MDNKNIYKIRSRKWKVQYTSCDLWRNWRQNQRNQNISLSVCCKNDVHIMLGSRDLTGRKKESEE